jgi:hypothetical protein
MNRDPYRGVRLACILSASPLYSAGGLVPVHSIRVLGAVKATAVCPLSPVFR